jgi:hypothetical protein
MIPIFYTLFKKLAMILYRGFENLDITEQSEQLKTETDVQKGVDASGKNETYISPFNVSSGILILIL